MTPVVARGDRSWRGTWTPDDRAESVWHSLAFDVPPGCPGLRLRLEHDRSSGPSGVLDLGLVDPHGWRGWSGGARRVVEIGGHGSTPGYTDRGLPPGRWEVVLGLHRVPAAGLAFAVDVELTAVRPEAAGPTPGPVPHAPRPVRRALPAPAGSRWLAGDCHAHTRHSDGVLTLDGLAALAAGQGLDFLWVTDHNTVSHHPHLSTVGKRYGIRLLPGQEVTTADGHANAFGDVGWVDFREPASSWLAQVAASGGLLSVNHPVAGDCAWRDPGGPVRPLPPVAEVWHSSWSDPADGAPLAWWDAAGRPAPIGGSDVHDPARDLPGAPTTWVLCEDDDVLAGMAAGRTAVSSAPDAPVLLRVEGELVAIDADGAQLVCRDGRRTPVHGIRRTLPGHPGPHVLERTDRRVLSLSA